MSKMITMRNQRKPPLPKSPSRLLTPRRVLRSTQNTALAPPPASLIRIPLGKRSSNIEEIELRPEYHTISCEIRALAKMVQSEFGKPNLGKTSSDIQYGSISHVLFERGRFYDEYAAKRNERLKRKRGQTEEEKEDKTGTDLGVGLESIQRTEPKRREVMKRAVFSTPMRENQVEKSTRRGAKRVVVSTPMTENRVGNSRYMLRSMNKENKKPPLPVKYEGSAVGKSVTRRARKI